MPSIVRSDVQWANAAMPDDTTFERNLGENSRMPRHPSKQLSPTESPEP